MITAEQFEDIFTCLSDVETDATDSWWVAAATLSNEMGVAVQLPKYGEGGRLIAGRRTLTDEHPSGPVYVEDVMFEVKIRGTGEDLVRNATDLLYCLDHFPDEVTPRDERTKAAT